MKVLASKVLLALGTMLAPCWSPWTLDLTGLTLTQLLTGSVLRAAGLLSTQAVPGWASTPDAAAYLETVTRVVLDAQQQEFKRLHDSCGAKGDCVSNPNSSTISDHFCQVCLYLLPPSGPTATDLVMLASLSRTLPLVPLVTPLVSPGCDPVTQGAAEALLEEVACLLADPGQLVTGLKAGDIRMPLG